MAQPENPNVDALERASRIQLNELFAKDPSDLTDSEVDMIVAEFRRIRGTFAAEDRAAKVQGRKTRISKGVRKDTSVETLDIAVEGLDEILRKEFFNE